MNAVAQFWNDVWSEGNADLLPTLFAPEATENGEPLDIKQFQEGVLRWRQISPTSKPTSTR